MDDRASPDVETVQNEQIVPSPDNIGNQQNPSSPGIDIETPSENDLTKDDKLDLLKKVNDLITTKFSTNLVTLLVDIDDPLINVLTTR